MTLSSFIVLRPPALPGVAITLMWTTVSTSSLAITLAITGLRMSARTKRDVADVTARRDDVDADDAARPRGRRRAARAKRRPRSRETPVTRTTLPVAAAMAAAAAYLPSLRRWTRVFFSSLRCFFFAMRLRRFLMTEPTGDLSELHDGTPAGAPGGPAQPIAPPAGTAETASGRGPPCGSARGGRLSRR